MSKHSLRRKPFITAQMIRHILIIRFRRVGDSVLTMGLCRSLKQSFPDAQIHLVLNAAIAPLFESHPDVDRVIGFKPDELHGLRYLKRVREVVHKTRYDAIIDMRSTVKTQFFSLFSLHTPYRIGWKKPYTLLGHNYRIDKPTDISRVEADLLLGQPLAAEGSWKPTTAFRLSITPDERSTYRCYMTEKGIDFGKPVVLCTVTARLAYKVLPYERMTRLLRHFIDRSGAQLVFNYAGEEETRAAQQIWNDLGQDPHVFLQIEAKGLRQLCALLSNCTFFFGNEGGPRHMAQALGIPSFAIFPPGIPKAIWLPADDRGMSRGISPDDFLPADRQKDMSYAERFGLITDGALVEQLDAMWHDVCNRPGPEGD